MKLTIEHLAAYLPYDLYFYKNRLRISNQKGKVNNPLDKDKMNLELIYYKEFVKNNGIKTFKLAYRKL